MSLLQRFMLGLKGSVGLPVWKKKLLYKMVEMQLKYRDHF